jgi:hypothetical protein
MKTKTPPEEDSVYALQGELGWCILRQMPSAAAGVQRDRLEGAYFPRSSSGTKQGSLSDSLLKPNVLDSSRVHTGAIRAFSGRGNTAGTSITPVVSR